MSKIAACVCVSAALLALLGILVFPHAVIRTASLSLDPTSSATEVIDIEGVVMQADLDLHWRMSLPFWGDITMQIQETVLLAGGPDHESFSVKIPNPSGSNLTLKPMTVMLSADPSGKLKEVVHLNISEISVPPGGAETRIHAAVEARATHATQTVSHYIEEGHGLKVMVTADPEVRVWNCPWQLHAAKIMSCEVSHDLTPSVSLQASSAKRRALLSRHRKGQSRTRKVGLECRYVGNG